MKAKFKNDNVRKEFKATLIIALVAVLLFGGIGIIRSIIDHGSESPASSVIVNKEEPKDDKEDKEEPKVDEEEPNKDVQGEVKEKLVKPFTVEAEVLRYFFDLEDSLDKQQKAVYYFEGVYKPSLGMDFSFNDQKFDVVAAFAGKVKEVVSDSLLGYVVKIENEEGLVATYASLSEVKVQEGETVKQGQIIGKAGTCTLESDLGNHLYFALQNKNGKALNPEKYFDVEIENI